MINANDLYYDTNDAVKFIALDTGLAPDIIEKVLMADVRYMKSIGIIDPD